MAVPQHLRRQLREALGQEAAEDFVSWMDSVDNARADIAELRSEMQVGFARVDARISALEANIERRFGALEGRFGALESAIERRTADLMKWSFAFWIGAVVAIAAVAKLIP